MGIFNSDNNKNKCPVTPDDKYWIEFTFRALVSNFGIAKLNSLETITDEHFLFSPKSSLIELIREVAAITELDIEIDEAEFFDDQLYVSSNLKFVKGRISEQKSFSTIVNAKKNLYKFNFAKSSNENREELISLIILELCDIKLKNSSLKNFTVTNWIYFKNIAGVYFGFGIQLANAAFIRRALYIGSSGIPLEFLSYAFACYLNVRNESFENLAIHASVHASPHIQKGVRFLKTDDESLISKQNLFEYLNKKKLEREGSQAYKQFDFHKAISCFEELLKLEPENVFYLSNLGYYLLRTNCFKRSILLIQKAITLKPQPFYFNNLGFGYLMLNNPIEAIYNFNESIKLKPDNAYLHRNYAIYYTRDSDFEKALEYFESAEKYDPLTELLHIYKGELFLKMNNYNEALIQFEKSKALREPEADHYINLTNKFIR